MKILINTDITSEQQQQIEAVSDALSLVRPQNSEAALREIVDTDIVFGGFNRSLFEKAKQLKWVQVSLPALMACCSQNLSRVMFS